MFHEKKRYLSENFKLRIMNRKNLHAQSDFRGIMKLIYVIQGTLDAVTRYDNYRMHKDDLLVINNGTRFSYDRVSNDIIVAEFDIPQNVFSPENFGYIGYVWCNSVAEPQKDYSNLKKTMKDILARYLLSRKTGHYFIAGFYQIIQILEDSFLMSREQVIGRVSENEQRISQIIAYIESNFNQELSLSDLSGLLNLSVPYLSKFISDNLGMTFSKYVSILRLKYAGNQLIHTNYSVTRIAMDSGFSNMKVFNKVFFQQYGVTPSEFRKSMTITESPEMESYEKELFGEVEEILAKEDANQRFRTINRIDVKNAEIVRIAPTWKNLISVGPVSELRNASVRKALLTYRQRIPVVYVRFWNVLTDEMNLGKYISENDLDYDYEYIDECMDFLLDNNFIPYWHLAFISKEFAVKQNIVEEIHIKYRSLDEIGGAFKALVKHLKHRYGKNVLNKWVFDLWYPQPYFVSSPSFLSEGEGLDYPVMMYKILKDYMPDTQIGAANFSMVYGEENIKNEMNRLIKRNIFPDFISCITYPYEFQNDARRWIFYEEYVYKQMISYRRLIDETKWKGLPIYIVEFGLSAFQRNLLNDTRFRGAYMISTVLQNLGNVDKIGIYILNDSYMSAMDTNQMLFGGSGLMTKNGIMKPAFFSILFLSKMEEYCVKKSKNYILTTDMKDNYVLLCHNLGRLPVDML
ncbi:MAG TPA: helix-turn-helix domain-containing protein, partial [Candidatus Mediterraneibacter vanvlietii]|nr:helix-turn-helix domain-containing protein [Candidatus Mediterraneibacter vanvlietii]